jgi:hypothetical protein
LPITKLETYVNPIDVTDLPHGIYTMKVTMSARINGTQKTLYSNTLTHKIIKFADGNETPLLTYLFPNSVATYVNNELSYYFATNETKIYTLIISVDNEIK